MFRFVTLDGVVIVKIPRGNPRENVITIHVYMSKEETIIYHNNAKIVLVILNVIMHIIITVLSKQTKRKQLQYMNTSILYVNMD